MSRRVVVTGLGVISALGNDTRSFWEGCLAGDSRVAPIPDDWRRYASFRSSIWSPLEQPDYGDLFSRVERAQHDPVTLMTCAAAHQALDSAGIVTAVADRRANTRALGDVDPDRVGVFVGTGVGGACSFMLNHAYHVLAGSRERLCELRDGPDAGALRESLEGVVERLALAPRFNPFVVSMIMPNAPAAYLGIKFGLRGPNQVCAQACASGTVALGRAFRAIAAGEADRALAGGSEYLDDPHGCIFQGFDICRALVRDCDPPQAANRPFDRSRSGFLFSQGAAAMLLLEAAEAAEARGAPVVAEITGFAESFDAHSMMNPEPEGRAMESMLRALLEQAGVSPGAVDYVNAHGTSTQNNDACEAAVIERVFGRRVAVNSSKSLLGHTIGASGALEAVVMALSLAHQRLHPTLNLEDPVADLDFVTEARSQTLEHAVSQSFAFGGHNAALLMARAAPGSG